MKKFWKLREPDGSPSGAAPAASAADTSGSAQSGSDAGSSSGSSSSPAVDSSASGGAQSSFLSLPDPNLDPVGFNARMGELTDEEVDLYSSGKFQFDKKDVSASAGDDPDSTEGHVEKTADSIEEDPTIFEGLDEKEFQSLPPKAQALIKAAQAKFESLKSLEPLFDPEAQKQLNDLLDHPQVRQIIDLQRRGENSLSFNAPDILTQQNIMSLVEKAGVNIDDLDMTIDRESGMQNLQKVIAHALETGIRSGELREQIKMGNQAKTREIETFFDTSLKDITTKVKALNSTLSVNDPKHPIAPFTAYLKQALESKQINYEFLKGHGGLEPMFLAWQATQKGGLQAIIQKPLANQRMKLLKDISDSAKNEAINAANRKISTGIPNDANVRFGVDGQRYLSDDKYKETILDKYSENDRMLDELGNLEMRGRWR